MTFVHCIMHLSDNCHWREMQPLNEAQRKNLRTNWLQVAAFLEPKDSLVNDLRAKGVITARQKQAIETQHASQQMDLLREIVSRKSLATIDVFLSCLPKEGEFLLRNLLDKNNGNAQHCGPFVAYKLSCNCIDSKLLLKQPDYCITGKFLRNII